MTIKPRQADIIRCLIVATTPLDIEFFIQKFHKSARTIRYDIQELNEMLVMYHIQILYITKQGYVIPASEKASCSTFLITQQSETTDVFRQHDEEERYQSIFLYLFKQKQHVSADVMAQQFYVSRSTLIRMLEKMKASYAGRFTLDARTASGYKLEGDEYALRQVATAIIATRFKGSYTAEDWYILLPDIIKDGIQLEQVITISRAIKALNAKYNIWISNASFLNLLSYCIVCIIRHPLHETPSDSIEIVHDMYIHELLLSLSSVGNGCNQKEFIWLCDVLASNGIFVQASLLEEHVLRRLLKRIMQYIEQREGPNMFDLQALYDDLFEHLNNFLNLSACGKQKEDHTNILAEVKQYYHSFYELAKECAPIIEEEAQLPFNTTEVCYLAVYLYKNSKHAERKNQNVLVVCATGKGLSHLLTLRIKHVFPMLNVVGQVSPYQVAGAGDLQDVDFVISTIPIKESRAPVVKISSILSSTDIQRIQDFMKYGKLIDEIPMNQKNETSFITKSNVLEYPTSMIYDSTLSMAKAAQILSQLILTLLETIARFPRNHLMGNDATLGLIIHMSMAVTRWMDQASEADYDEEFTREYDRFRQRYPQKFTLMEKFFEVTQETLQIKITMAERVAFFLYMSEEDGI